MKNDKGFTLVELIVTIALLGILGTVIAVNMVGLNKNQEEKENKRMSSIIEAAAEAYVEKEDYEGCVPVKTLIEEGYLKASDVEKYKGKSVKIEDGKYTLQDGDNCQPTKKEYTVTYEPSEGEIISGNKTQQIENGEKYIFPKVERTGYDLKGWYTQKEEGTRIAKSSEDNIVANISGDQTLYAHWTAKEIIVSFVPNLEGVQKPSDITVTYDKTYGEKSNFPESPSKNGYEFNGWFLNDKGTGVQITKDSKVEQAEDHILYGKWSLKEYTITFNGNGGKPTESTRKITKGRTYGNLPSATKTGYSLEGWYTEQQQGTKITESMTYDIEGDQTLYAHWLANEYTLTFNANGGTISENEKTRQVKYDSEYGNMPTPSRTGYDFQGWYPTASGGTKVNATDTYKTADNQTLYAHWQGKSVTINFNPNGGSVSTSSKTYTYGQIYGSLPTPTRTGYNFDGWYTSSSGGTKITTSSKVNYTTTTTLYAHWQAKTFTVYFDANGGSNLSFSSKTVTYGSTYGNLPTAKAPSSMENYPLEGWYTQKEGGTKIEASTLVTLTNNQTLYAQYKDNIPPTCVPDSEIKVDWFNGYWYQDYGTWVDTDRTSGYYVDYNFTCQDEGSGCTETTQSITKRVGSNNAWSYLCEYAPVTITDKAGNESTCFLETKIDSQKPYTPIITNMDFGSGVRRATYECEVRDTGETFSSDNPNPNLKTYSRINCYVSISYYGTVTKDRNVSYTIKLFDEGIGINRILYRIPCALGVSHGDSCTNQYKPYGFNSKLTIPEDEMGEIYIRATDSAGSGYNTGSGNQSSDLHIEFNYTSR